MPREVVEHTRNLGDMAGEMAEVRINAQVNTHTLAV